MDRDGYGYRDPVAFEKFVEKEFSRLNGSVYLDFAGFLPVTI